MLIPIDLVSKYDTINLGGNMIHLLLAFQVFFSTTFLQPNITEYHTKEVNFPVAIVNPTPYSPEVLDKFKKKIIAHSYSYQEEANKRNIYVFMPFVKYNFHIEKNNSHLGQCRDEKSEISLTLEFDESTFFHELGHCDFNYAHRSSEKITEEGYSPYIMSWGFKEELLFDNRKVVLDDFFNKNNHKEIYSTAGLDEHNKMHLQHLGYSKAEIIAFNRKRDMSELNAKYMLSKLKFLDQVVFDIINYTNKDIISSEVFSHYKTIKEDTLVKNLYENCKTLHVNFSSVFENGIACANGVFFGKDHKTNEFFVEKDKVQLLKNKNLNLVRDILEKKIGNAGLLIESYCKNDNFTKGNNDNFQCGELNCKINKHFGRNYNGVHCKLHGYKEESFAYGDVHLVKELLKEKRNGRFIANAK